MKPNVLPVVKDGAVLGAVSSMAYLQAKNLLGSNAQQEFRMVDGQRRLCWVPVRAYAYGGRPF